MIKHTRTIESEGTGEDKEYSVSCSCRTNYRSRLRSHAEAVEVDQAHKAAVADGTWQAEQDAKAAKAEALAPKHAAIRAHNDAVEAVRNAAFEILIAKQYGRDVEAARAEYDAAKATMEATAQALDVG